MTTIAAKNNRSIAILINIRLGRMHEMKIINQEIIDK